MVGSGEENVEFLKLLCLYHVYSNFVVSRREDLSDFWSVQGIIERIQPQKLRNLRQEREGEKNNNVKVAKPCQREANFFT